MAPMALPHNRVWATLGGEHIQWFSPPLSLFNADGFSSKRALGGSEVSGHHAKFLLLRKSTLRKSETKSHFGGSNTFFLSENLRSLFFGLEEKGGWEIKIDGSKQCLRSTQSRKCLGSQLINCQ